LRRWRYAPRFVDGIAVEALTEATIRIWMNLVSDCPRNDILATR
jgi:hypothetical protein